MIKDLILKNRSYRRFDESVQISAEQLKKWIDLARLSGSGKNMQPMKYILSVDPDKNEKIFSTLGWAGYLKDWDGPVKGEQPVAYIVQLLDTSISEQFFCDDGIAMQSILLGAVEEGFGGCIFRTINKPKLMGYLNIPEQFQIINVIALGKPVEKVVIEKVKNGDIKYWRDEKGTHHVPKRGLDELIIDL
ncbi:MAG: nitroreductase family protein [Prolixibacteraceae bacterium]|nr:nitroreductase family protein [Prolixibacteraceae bacterium]